MKQLIGLCFATTFALTAHSQEQQLQPESAAVEALKPFLTKPSKHVRKIVSSYELTGSAKAQGETSVEFQRLEDGFLASASRTILQDGKGGGNTLQASACGLVAVSMQRYTVMEGPAAVVNIAGAFVGLGMKVSTDIKWSARLISIQIEQGKLCRPQTNESIKFTTETEHKIKVAGRMMSGVRKETTTCTVQSAATKLAELDASSSGDYIPVSCEITTAQGSKAVKKYAFLAEAEQYVLLNESDDRASTSYRPKFIELGQ